MNQRNKKSKTNSIVSQSLDFVNDVKNVFRSDHVKKTFRIGNDIFVAIQPFIEKQSTWNACRAMFGIGKIFVDDVETWSDTYFDIDEWIEPYSRDLNVTILKALTRYPQTKVKTADKNCVIHLIDLEGVKVGWTHNPHSNSVNNINVEIDKFDQARKIIKRLLWEHYKNKPLVLKFNPNLAFNADESRIAFEVDDAFHPLPSQKATEYAVYLKRCFDANVSRGVMLYGPPGTGKSTMARTIIKNLGLTSLRVRVEDITNLENNTLFEAINIFEPDAIILDDFDKSHSQASLFETLEFFQRHVKLIIATVNNKDNLDEALLRPGRFDELIFVDQMDSGVVKHILGVYNDGYDFVKNWPVVFIQEYVKRRRFMDQSETENSMKELASRVQRLESYRVDGDMWKNFENDTPIDVKHVPPIPKFGKKTYVSDLLANFKKKQRSKLLNLRNVLTSESMVYVVLILTTR